MIRYCPVCKKHCQASKKLDLWRLPEILVIHLKRFSYNRFLKNKLETFVDFPTHNLDLLTYIAYKNGQSSYRYMLYAISNHYGSMGGGHYTAFVHVSVVSFQLTSTSTSVCFFFQMLFCFSLHPLSIVPILSTAIHKVSNISNSLTLL